MPESTLSTKQQMHNRMFLILLTQFERAKTYRPTDDRGEEQNENNSHFHCVGVPSQHWRVTRDTQV